MARWHKRLPSLTVPPFPRVCCRCLCVSTCLVTHMYTHAHIESSQNGTTLAVNNASSTRSCLQGASRVCVCMSAWVSVCVCVVRECGLCHVRHFVTYFLSFVSCVFASFSASLVSGDSSSSSLHVTHTHTSPSACVLVLWLSVSQCLCVCVPENVTLFLARKATPRLSHSRPHSGLHSKAHSHLHTPAYQSVEKKYMALPPLGGWLALCCCHFCCNFMATFITFICIFTSWIVFVALLLCLTWEFYERLTPCSSCSATDMHGSKMNF